MELAKREFSSNLSKNSFDRGLKKKNLYRRFYIESFKYLKTYLQTDLSTTQKLAFHVAEGFFRRQSQFVIGWF